MRVYIINDKHYKFNMEAYNKAVESYITNSSMKGLSITRKDVYNKLSFNYEVAMNWAKGKCSPQNVGTVKKIANALGCNIDDFFEPLTDEEVKKYLEKTRNRVYPDKRERMRRKLQKMKENLVNNKSVEDFLDFLEGQFRNGGFVVNLLSKGNTQSLITPLPCSRTWDVFNLPFRVAYDRENGNFGSASVNLGYWILNDAESDIQYLRLYCQTYEEFCESTKYLRDVIDTQKREYVHLKVKFDELSKE